MLPLTMPDDEGKRSVVIGMGKWFLTEEAPDRIAHERSKHHQLQLLQRRHFDITLT